MTTSALRGVTCACLSATPTTWAGGRPAPGPAAVRSAKTTSSGVDIPPAPGGTAPAPAAPAAAAAMAFWISSSAVVARPAAFKARSTFSRDAGSPEATRAAPRTSAGASPASFPTRASSVSTTSSGVCGAAPGMAPGDAPGAALAPGVFKASDVGPTPKPLGPGAAIAAFKASPSTFEEGSPAPGPAASFSARMTLSVVISTPACRRAVPTTSAGG
mmetsp:Transcript_69524/g.96660  ORF Transcript_69524/g.96660 Transcript_69524/m.96660 type:complete len:216 (-) Transcript_69524:347-994(-)